MFSTFMQRPWEVLSSSLEILGHDIPLTAKIDAMISRAIHGLGQPNTAISSLRPNSIATDPRPGKIIPGNSQGLILSGGGAYAAYEVGVMRALFEGKSSATGFKEWNPAIIAGTSAGSLNASLLLSIDDEGLPLIENLEHIWFDQIADAPGRCGSGVFRFRDNPLTLLNPGCYRDPAELMLRFLSDNAFLAEEFIERGSHLFDSSTDIEQRALETVNLGALICVDPLKELLRRNLNLERIRASQKQLRIAATNWRTGSVKVFSNEDMTDEIGHRVIQASSSIPGIFPRVEIDGDPYVDGGLVMNTPLKPAIDAGAEVMQVIFMDPEVAHIPLPRLSNTANDMYRALVIGFSATLKRDLAVAAKVNKGVDAVMEDMADGEPRSEAEAFAQSKDGEPHRKLMIHLHHPNHALGGGWLSFGIDQIRETMQRGYDDTVNHDCIMNKCLLQ